jgi:hypothetical protein
MIFTTYIVCNGQKALDENPDPPPGGIMLILGNEWNAMSKEEKASYEAKAGTPSPSARFSPPVRTPGSASRYEPYPST